MNSKRKTLTVAHNAGGAEVIAAWAKAHPEEGPFIHAATGPAVRPFEKRGLPVVETSLELVSDDIRRVVVGPGWDSVAEFRIIQEAKRRGVQSIAYLDHWVNFRLRFGFPRDGWKENVADEIWVGDDVALSIATLEFPWLPVHLVPNEYMKEIQRDFASIQARVKEESDLVLFLSEPMSEPTTIFGDPQGVSFDEFGVLRELIERLNGSGYRLLVRLHPSEPREKYQDLGVEISQEPDLLVDIAKAKIMVGMSTMALAHAAACGKTAWSIWPDLDTSIPPLPVPGIRSVSSAKEIALP